MNVLELGSGTGFLGMTIARNARRDVGVVALTEMEAGGALEWLKKCVAKNEGKGLWRDGAVTCAACDWNEYAREDDERRATGTDAAPGPSVIDSTPWDLMIGSDLVYDDAGTRALPKVMRALLVRAKRARARARDEVTASAADADADADADAASRRLALEPAFIYCHTLWRYELRDVDFFAQLTACGLAFEEVAEPGAPPPPEPPEPFAELFPEQRAAVFRVTLAPPRDEDARVRGGVGA